MTDVQSGGSKGKEPVGVVYAVPEGKRISVGSPSLIALANGKLLAAFDQTGPDVKGLTGKKGHDAKRNRWMQGLVMCSADSGATWQRVAAYPYRRATLFRDGGDVYLLGEASGGLCLMRSPDGGSSWSAPMELTGDLDVWLSPTAVGTAGDSWVVPCLAPSGGDLGLMVWRAPRGASLMNRKAWTQGPVSPPLSEFLATASPGACGVPWPGATPTWRHPVAVNVSAAHHPWHRDGTLPVLATAGCGREHWGALMRVATGDLSVSVQEVEDGLPWLWVPLPGGHAKFDVFYDESSHLHWLVGSRGTSGLAVGREAGRDGESRRIGLWASANLVDWQFAAPVLSGGEGAPGLRLDPSAAVSGNDLFVACRAGGTQSRHARETSQILCTRVDQFRLRWA